MLIIISKDYQFIQLLRTNLRILYSSRKRKPQDRIHVSDILSGSRLLNALYAHTFKDYELTVKDIDCFERGESSEYVLVGLAGFGISQNEYLFKGSLIARPDLMTGVKSQKTQDQDMVSTNNGK